MASMVAKACSSTSQFSPAMTVQEKGSRNKRKFRADPPIPDPNKIIPLAQNEGSNYELVAENFEISSSDVHSNVASVCNVLQDHSDALKLDLGLPCAAGSSEAGSSWPREEVLATEEPHDADWSDLTEAQLEELVLSNLDAIFKSAIKKIVACGYSEDVATKAVLRSGLCYGCRDTVSNVVDNTLAFLRNGQEIDPSREHYFEDLQQLEKYILTELVCVLKEVRPFFSTGDAMWCLLICDMNVAHACAMNGDPLSGFFTEEAPNASASASAQPQLTTEAKSSEASLAHTCKPNPSIACPDGCSSETPSMGQASCAHSPQTEIPNVGAPDLKSKTTFVLNGLVPEKDCSNSTSNTFDKSFGIAGTSRSTGDEEKFAATRKVSGITKREYILRQKSIHLEKHYRTYGSKGSRSGKLSSFGGLILDKKLKAVSDSTGISVKNASFRINRSMGADTPQDSVDCNISETTGGLPSSAFSLETVNSLSTLPKNQSSPAAPVVNAPPALSAADTELSLSLPAKISSAPGPVSSNAQARNPSYAGMPYDKSLGQWVPQDKKDEMILKMAPKIQELQNQLNEWTEWANQKVMQAARRLSKDKAELKTLRQEKEEVERLKKEKQTLEENTMKKLSEMENALCKASGQVERANTAVRRLEAENAVLRQEMEAAKLRAAETAASCQEVSKREKNTLINYQSWEKEKALIKEELLTEKQKLAQLQKELGQAMDLQHQLEAKWKQEEKAKDGLLTQSNSLRKERERSEASTNSKEDMFKLKAENNLQRCKDDIEKLEKEISQLRLKTDSPKIAALRRGIDGSYASLLMDSRNAPASRDFHTPNVSKVMSDIFYYSGGDGVKRERECVMCLSEEMSVVFLPCAHQVVCASCNDLHEKQGMKDCPSCRSPIQQRICVRYACA